MASAAFSGLVLAAAMGLYASHTRRIASDQPSAS
jgi:hypothetical protein